jgi:glycosyltransferase involved in cell wall biosynthesis
MRVGINAYLCTARGGYRRTGVHRYIHELIAAISGLTDAPDLVAYVQEMTEDATWSNVRQRKAPVSVQLPALRIGFELAGLPVLARRDRLDLFHGPVNTLPFGLPVPGSVMVHDLAFLRYPEQVTAKRYSYLKHMIGSSVRRAALVLTPSEATRQDVIEQFGLPADRVRVTPLGVDDRYRSDLVRTRTGRPSILSVGTLEPRKNLPRLIAASAELQSEIEHDFILAGPDGWLMDEITVAIETYPNRDRFQRLGFVDDETLATLYASATVVAVPSLYEGFGLPVLEAMSAGAAVVTSRVSSLPEVAGDAAEYVDPDFTESILDGLRRVLTDVGLRQSLQERGRIRARDFTWTRTAGMTVRAWSDLLR